MRFLHFLQILHVTTFHSQSLKGWIEPHSPSGPTMPSSVEKKPRAKKTENKIVANMNTPNCKNKMISASSRNAEPPIVVHAPDNTDIPS